MQSVRARVNWVLGVALVCATAFPLACGSDDGGKAGDGESGAGNAQGEAGSGEGGAATAHGGTTQAGNAQGGNAHAGSAQGGVGQAGAGDASGAGATNSSGAGGAAEPMGGAGGAEPMGGAGGATEVDPFADNVDTVCTTEGSLDCSGSGAAADKQACLDTYSGILDFAAACTPQVEALVACLATKSAESYECVEMQAFPKVDACTDENAAFNDCLATL